MLLLVVDDLDPRLVRHILANEGSVSGDPDAYSPTLGIKKGAQSLARRSQLARRPLELKSLRLSLADQLLDGGEAPASRYRLSVVVHGDSNMSSTESLAQVHHDSRQFRATGGIG